MTFKFRRGTEAERLLLDGGAYPTPLDGEPLYTTDEHKLFVGDGSTTGGVEIGGDHTHVVSDITDIDDYAPSRLEWNQNGFKDVDGGSPQNDVLITWDDATRTLSVSPVDTSFDYYIKGEKYTETGTMTAQIGTGVVGDEGLWAFYISSISGFRAAQNLSHDSIDEVIKKTCIVAYVYWDATNETGKLMWEAHGMSMSPGTHHWLHDNMGAQYREGMTLGDFSDVDGDGDDETDVQFTISEGVFYDEDIEHTIAALAIGGNIELWHLEGTDWRWETTTVPGRISGVVGEDRLAWNDAGTQTEVDSGDLCLVHIFATNIISSTVGGDGQYLFIQGQAEYDNKSQARAGAEVEINNLVYGTLPLEEVVPVATVILQTNNLYDNSIKSRITVTDSGDNWLDWRSSNLKASGGAIADHGNLGGLTDDDHAQYHNDVRAEDWLVTDIHGDIDFNTLTAEGLYFDTGATASISYDTGTTTFTINQDTIVDGVISGSSVLGVDFSDVSNTGHTHDPTKQTYKKIIYIEDPELTDSFPVLSVPFACTITRITHITDVGTVDWNLEERAEATPDTVGTDVYASDEQSSTTNSVDTSFTNGSIAAHSWLHYSASAVASSPTKLWIAITYEEVV